MHYTLNTFREKHCLFIDFYFKHESSVSLQKAKYGFLRSCKDFRTGRGKSCTAAILFRTGCTTELTAGAQYRSQCDKSATAERKSLNKKVSWIFHTELRSVVRGAKNVRFGLKKKEKRQRQKKMEGGKAERAICRNSIASFVV